MGIRVGLTLFPVLALMIILGMNQEAYAGASINAEVQKTTTSGNGIFTFDLFGSGDLQNSLDTCSIDTSFQSSCSLSSNQVDSYRIIERPQAGWMQDSTTCPGSIDLNQLPIICQFVNSPKFVGGEMIPVDSTALLLTGAQTTSAWMIPVIVSGIGFVIVIARKF